MVICAEEVLVSVRDKMQQHNGVRPVENKIFPNLIALAETNARQKLHLTRILREGKIESVYLNINLSRYFLVSKFGVS